jgi:hypothetical protein
LTLLQPEICFTGADLQACVVDASSQSNALDPEAKFVGRFTNHKCIHRNRKGVSQCHTLQSEKKIRATLSFTTKITAPANPWF